MCQYSLLAIVAIALIAGVSEALPPKRIVGGQSAAPDEFPYQVSLRLNGTHHCGGTIITSRLVVTAAHCLLNISISNLLIVTGSIKLNEGQTHTVNSIHSHPEFSSIRGSLSARDIGIVVVNEKIKLNTRQAALALPDGRLPENENKTGKISGWGSTEAYSWNMPNILLKNTVTVLTAAECRQHADRVTVNNETVCAYGVDGTAPSFGDSGGPLFYNNQLIGVASYGYPCCTGIPDVYTSVYHFVDWIHGIESQTQLYG